MNRYWFKPKALGYGATPVTWEGWALSLGYLLLVLVWTLGLIGSEPTVQRWAMWLVLLAVATIAITWLAKRKTDGEWRWRWGPMKTGKMF